MRTYLFILIVPLVLAVSDAFAQQASLLNLMPRPKVAWQAEGPFASSRALSGGTTIMVPLNADSATMRAALLIQRRARQMRPRVTLPIVTAESFSKWSDVILIGYKDSYATLTDSIRRYMPPGEEFPPAGGYVLHVIGSSLSSGPVCLVGSDAEGIFNGAATVVQLMSPGDETIRLPYCHIWDYPDYDIRWVFSQHNLRGTGAITNLRKIQDTMAWYKLNGLQQNDFKYSILAEQPPNYFDSVRLFRNNAAATNTEIIPGVMPIGWSSGILWNDPMLAEGFPATALYVIESDTGRLLPDPRVSLPNGSFESIDGNGRFTGWSFYDDGIVQDRAVVHGGTASARATDFTTGNPAGNSRFNRVMDCQPNRAYVMSAWVRTENFRGDMVQLLALGRAPDGSTRSLTHTALDIPSTTSGWRRVEVTFNTLEYSTVLLYAGVWGGRAGTIWWDDFEIRDAGIANVLRRDGTPLHVRNAGTGADYSEGTDFEPVIDSVYLRSGGDYGPHHAPPVLRRAGSALRNGDTVRVSWFHPVATVSDNQGNGSVMVCVSEEKLYDVLADQVARVDSLYAPRRFFMGHDEIRSMNRDSACLRRGLEPADLLADNLRRCAEIIERRSPGAETFVWSDMFDSLHNAHDDYYLINGDLTGIWNSIPRTPVIVNWNGGNARRSLEKFAGLGFRQITSPYYDERGTRNMREWRLAMEGVTGMRGMMYTTWAADYDFLRPFAHYAWGAGPYIVHTPLDTSVLGADSMCLRAVILADPYNPLDSIVNVIGRIYGPGDRERVVFPRRVRDSLFEICLDPALHDSLRGGFYYRIEAYNAEGLARYTHRYCVGAMPPSGVADGAGPGRFTVRLAPNPATGDEATAWLALPRPGGWRLRVSDLAGRAVFESDGVCEQECAVRIPTGTLAAGTYVCALQSGSNRAFARLQIVR